MVLTTMMMIIMLVEVVVADTMDLTTAKNTRRNRIVMFAVTWLRPHLCHHTTMEEDLPYMGGMSTYHQDRRRHTNGLFTLLMTPIVNCCMWAALLMCVIDGVQQKVHVSIETRTTLASTSTLKKGVQNTLTLGMSDTSPGPSLTTLSHLKRGWRQLDMEAKDAPVVSVKD